MIDMTSITTMAKSFPPWMLLGVGFVGGYLKSAWNFVYGHTIGLVVKKMCVNLVVEEIDHYEAFVWLNLWMEKNLKKRRIASLRIEKKKYQDDNNPDDRDFELLPAYGFYWFLWNKKILTFYSEKQENSQGNTYGGSAGALKRTITLSVWGTRDRKVLLDVILEAKKDYEDARPKHMKYYTDNEGYWESNTMEDRLLETIYLPKGLLSDVLADFQLFFESKTKYRSLGVPWRRGYLLEGPPGGGKSSLIQALSCKFKVPIYYLNAANQSIQTIKNLVLSVSPPCILLIEDVDSLDAALDRETKEDKDKMGLKPSDLLNLLDGLIATEQRIVIMTSNHPDKLDPALLRAGRVDRRYHLGYSQEEELRAFHGRANQFYPLPEYGIFRAELPEKCTIADAQAEVFKHQVRPEKEIENVLESALDIQEVLC